MAQIIIDLRVGVDEVKEPSISDKGVGDLCRRHGKMPQPLRGNMKAIRMPVTSGPFVRRDNGSHHFHGSGGALSCRKSILSGSGLMGVSRKQAAKNRQVIIVAATRLVRGRGIARVGLNELMHEAGFTQGGFYNYFESKDALVAEVIAHAVTEDNEGLWKAIAKPLGSDSANAFARQIKYYLSAGHRDDIEKSCSVAMLATEVWRLGKEMQAKYVQGLAATLN
jgi:hypothetical protein